MDATENMLTRIITRVWPEKADKLKLPFSEVRKTIDHSLAATTLFTRVFESGKKH